MKKILIPLILLITYYCAKADDITLNNSYLSDSLLLPFSSYEDSTIYSLKISESIIAFNSDTSLVRVVLVDNKNNQYLVVESYPLLDNSDTVQLNGYGEETLWLQGIKPKSLKIIINDATINLGKITIDLKNPNYTTEYIQQQKDLLRQDKINRLNDNLISRNYPWRAGNTAASNLSYDKKAEFFGERFNDGFEYYLSGFFATPNTNLSMSSNLIVKSFDWRNRHGADQVDSPYYDGDIESSGWLAPPSYQNGCLLNGYVQYLNCTDCENAGGVFVEAQTCWAFGPVAAIEAVTNLYFNQHLDIELSQQEVVSCAWNGGANPSSSGYTFAYAKNNGIINETCYPYLADDGDCNDKCSNPDDVISIYDYSSIDYDELSYKQNLIEYGPLSARHATWSHTFTLVGYGVVKEGDYIDYTTGETIQEGSPYIGCTYWIFRNSGLFGGWPYHVSYTYMLDMPRPMTRKIHTPIFSQNYSDSDRVCIDADLDGYYNWGIGSKPSSCANCPDEQDCDDSNPFLGAYDQKFGCTLICDNFTFDNITEVITQDQEFYDNTFINYNLQIDNARLVVNDNLLLHDDVTITVNTGSNLIINENAVVKGACNDQSFDGNIIVEEGATMTLKTNSNIFLNSNLIINGLLVIEPNVNIILNDELACLEIKGSVDIEDNATFTFTGDGYIKFSNPGDDNTQNITCGSGASVVLQGSGKDDKILEVQQNTVRFPTKLSSLEFSNGKIEMGNDKRMLAQGNYPLTFNNIKITSDNGVYNAHRSFHIYGQSNVTVTDCIFEHGYWGLYGNLTYNAGAPLTISDCEFNNNREGLYIYNKGIHLSGCSFSNNTERALNCDNMSMVSDLYRCEMDNNQYGIDFQGSSSADLDVTVCDITNNTYDGILTSGSMDLRLECNNITNNSQGVRSLNGTFVKINDDAENNITSNNTSININYGYILLDGGYNQLQPNTGGKSLTGRLSTKAACGTPVTIPADHNQYKVPSTVPVSGTDYALTVYNCQPKTAIYLGATTCDYTVCYHFVPIPLNSVSPDAVGQEALSGNETTILSMGDSGETLDEIVTNLGEQLETNLSLSQCLTLIDEHIDVIGSCISSPLEEVDKWKRIAWGNLHDAVDIYYNMIERDNSDNTFNQVIDNVITLNNNLLQDAELTDVEYVTYSLDNALLNRMRGEYEISINQLTNLAGSITDMPSELALVESWLCHVNAEKLASEGILSPDEFFSAISDCNSVYENAIEALDSESEDDITEVQVISISPNPSNGSFTVHLENVMEGSELKIVNSYSQPIAIEEISEEGNTDLQFNGYAAGFYTIYYLENGVVVDSEGLVVE